MPQHAPVQTASCHDPRAALPQPPTQLFGVFCPSAKDCWAVGEVRHGSADANQMLHWNGKKWRSVAVPNRPEQAGTRLTSSTRSAA
jgi:hypothetical protein